jgi:hypothetical protein
VLLLHRAALYIHVTVLHRAALYIHVTVLLLLLHRNRFPFN